MSKRRISARTYIEDMLQSCTHILTFTSDMTSEIFLEDVRTQFAVIRALEVPGEAAGQLLDTWGAGDPRFASLPLRKMYATRNRLIHGYDTVLPQTV